MKTVQDIHSMKGQNTIVMVTAYDWFSASICEEAGVDIILVGDSLAMTVLGYDSTIPITMDEMLVFVKATRRGARNTFVVADMPFMSYQVSIQDALKNACRMIKEGGANAVKLEGASDTILEIIDKMRDVGIQVMGHIGLTPQSSVFSQGYRIRGKDVGEAKELVAQAKALEEAGCFSLVLECVPEPLGADISDAVSIPVIGIGAGRFCDGQVLVFSDIVGFYNKMSPKFVKRYLNGFDMVKNAVASFVNEVREGIFPSEKNVYK